MAYVFPPIYVTLTLWNIYKTKLVPVLTYIILYRNTYKEPFPPQSLLP